MYTSLDAAIFQSADTLPALSEEDILWPDTEYAFERRPTGRFPRASLPVPVTEDSHNV